MLQVKRYIQNPIITPNPANSWESWATFNGNVIKDGSLYHIFYRAMGNEQNYQGYGNFRLSTVGHAISHDGFTFENRSLFLHPEFEWERFGCEDPRITKFEDTYFLFYTALSTNPPQAKGIRVGVALSKDLKTVQERHLVTPFNAKAMALFPERVNGKITAILSVNTDNPPSHIAIAQFDTIDQIWSDSYWRDWYRQLNEHRVHLKRMKTDQVEVGAPPIKTPLGWLFAYSYIINYTTPHPVFTIEMVMLDPSNPRHVIGRIPEPILEPQEPYEFEGIVRNIVFPSGITVAENDMHIYYGATDTTCCVATADYQNILSHFEHTTVELPKLTRYEGNPLLEPVAQHPWEAKAVFNPAILQAENKTFIIYRSLSNDDTSTMGCAISQSGVHIDERLPDPVYVPRAPFEMRKNNGGSGCEDPRLTRIGDRVYMCYTAYDGVDNPRVALTSILYDDFVNKKWIWKMPQLISPPGMDDKDACILEEKVNGKYVIFHRIGQDIVLDYVDNLNFANDQWLQIHDVITPRKGWWDSRKIGISAPPINTPDGWILLYHGISEADNEYRVGAMLLQKDRPATVLSRTEFPLLEPELPFEKEGIVNNVVFPCGAAVIKGILHVYYGGADKAIGLATIPLQELLDYLKERSQRRHLLTDK